MKLPRTLGNQDLPSLYCRVKTLSQHSILSSEKALVAEYKRTSKFYDVVIEKIIAINRGGEIHFQ